ncbi:DUF202 domain-containing protein [Clostridium sp. DJ247]|uniref:DUF202 domain-containing protein n=1 Tax=Clostridium sp. DJ247 TaxID=2726188 RepID=UPI0016257F20|nr:DUF202 domain-containing protein [Clostridium sp. DJ247]MBC2582361.1 DUF202 domain-containing protein [Clostridium sp. DJ247]
MKDDVDFYNHNKEDMILRDFLAVDRTMLANERTFLAYIRTALGSIITGVTFIKLFDSKTIQALGYLFVPMGFIIFVFGLYRFIKIYRRISKIKF